MSKILKIPCFFSSAITLKFLIYVEGMDVSIILNQESESKMTGKAVHSEGEIPITLTKVPEKE